MFVMYDVVRFVKSVLYLRFSGITSMMLKSVTTRLADVQTKILQLLPPDAVLVGHSLDNDLRVLQVR